jgi:hypothetical protein
VRVASHTVAIVRPSDGSTIVSTSCPLDSTKIPSMNSRSSVISPSPWTILFDIHMPIARRIGISVLSCSIAALLAVWPGTARAQQLHVDLDRDGVRDNVTIQHAPVSAVRVWLSTSQSERQLRTPVPVLRLAAADVDGDGRPELFAAGASPILLAWRQVAHGRFRPIHPRPDVRTPRYATTRIADVDPGEAPALACPRENELLRDDAHAPHGPPIEVVALALARDAAPIAPLFWTPSDPRAPPLVTFSSPSF